MGYAYKIVRKLRTKAGSWLGAGKPEPLVFATKPANLRLIPPYEVRGAERMYVGDDVHLGSGSILKAITETSDLMRNPEGTHVEQTFDPVVRIGNRVSATASLHVAAHREIVIEDDVMLSSNVFISDASHGYRHAGIPYKYQGMTRVLPIRIGRGSWIGQNVVVMPGVSIGEMVIVGANSTVTRDIPARSIAVGSPARVIKRWDDECQEWVAVASDALSVGG